MVRTVAEMLGQAHASVGVESPASAADALADGSAVLVDVRQSDEFAACRIAGSIQVARGLLEFAADPASGHHRTELQPEARIIVVSTSGARGALAAATLQSMGFVDVAVLEGGLTAWMAEGRPVATPEHSAA
ncbi:rhodanese-like domain-containing protein [Agromyces aurantiacus]|uniref:Rhodanese-like domain-containing protein n=1 Tax=Agromyces aurantiacus TaxID=165814 RepID=A0ABV9R6J1_9MICO|nr:rhodanese-like domain-containing protein [Agromyces aurantiacus]MBM7503848.1 rhodanese-related sulfurtransferase [Agromyces aurantiacus]